MISYSPQKVLETLKGGNQRFLEGKSWHWNHSPGRLIELEDGQHPMAAVLCCSDSRVQPTILFDVGLGDLFTVQNAGAVLSDEAIASLGFAVDTLGVPLILALGHTGCGAVAMACDENADACNPVVARILPSKEEVVPCCCSELLGKVEARHLQANTEALRQINFAREVTVASAMVNTATGEVTWYD